MWGYDEFIGKAQAYFARAGEHPRADDEVLAIWLLLGLEFLLRAPLARVNPTLLAEPTGDSIMHAAGFPGLADSKEPMSITTKTVLLRLPRIIEAFSPERVSDATILTNLRNKELHSSEVAVAIESSFWLPRFIRVVDVVCAHLGLDAGDLIGKEVEAQGRALVDAENQKLVAEVRKQIAACKTFFGNLRPEEITSRRLLIPALRPPFQVGDAVPETNPEAFAAYMQIRKDTGVSPEMIQCPACEQQAALRLRRIRETNVRYEEEWITKDIIYVATGMTCAVCGLALTSTEEIRSAGLKQQYIREESENLEEMFAERYDSRAYDGEDYGND